jgi:hypothetical protein
MYCDKKPLFFSAEYRVIPMGGQAKNGYEIDCHDSVMFPLSFSQEGMRIDYLAALPLILFPLFRRFAASTARPVASPTANMNHAGKGAVIRVMKNP